MKNLKTTLAGLMTGLLLAGNALMEAYAAGTFDGKTGKQLLVAIGLFLIGWYAQDKGKKQDLIGDRPDDRK